MHSFLNALLKEINSKRVLTGEYMKNHTTFKIGGPADFMVFPENEEELGRLLKLCSSYNVKHMIIGNGSNLLFSDEGYKGIIIKLAKNFSYVETDGLRMTARPGAMLSTLARSALDKGLSGLEFASGIPGTLGGAVYMNAGAYGREIKDIFHSCRVMDANGKIRTLYASDMQFGYRHSVLQSSGDVATSITIELKSGSYGDIKREMDSYNMNRKEKQPLELPSAGSIFKRPEGYFIGRLIEDAGLKGLSVGGAQVSDKHAGFIVNKGGASCKDVIGLIDRVKAAVYEQFDVKLETEVKIIK